MRDLLHAAEDELKVMDKDWLKTLHGAGMLNYHRETEVA